MNYSLYYHRHSNLLVRNDNKFKKDYNQIIKVINSISDSDLIKKFNSRKTERKNIKSLSEPINSLLKERLENLGWNSESGLFKVPPYLIKLSIEV